MSAPQDIKVLIIEDSDDDAILICEELRRGGYNPVFHRVDTADTLKRALGENEYDIIISDYSLPQFTALEALKIIQESGKDIPVIVVSGSVREATIVEVMRAGARDYVMKENLTRLPLAVSRELAEAAERRRLRQFDEQLRHTQRLESLGVLAGGVAHDFNNLLTGILGNVSFVLEESQGSQSRSMLEQALQAAEQAANLTRQMLAYAGKGKFFVERLDISAVTRDIGALLAASVSKNIHLIYELRSGLPAVEADRGQIQQLVMNLVINAAEAIGPDKTGTILVTTGTHHLSESDLRRTVVRDSLQPGEYVCLEVCDTGSGIDAENMPRIFDPFFTTKFTGRGLGLSAVMGIVRSHHGTLSLKSHPGKGTTFTVFLPAVHGAPLANKSSAAQNSSALKGIALVIDDQETIRRTAKMILENRGMQVFVAETGPAAMEIFRQLTDRISVVLLDLTMPIMNGNDVLREIRTLRMDVPVIMSSGYDESEAMQRVNAGAVAGFIQKPYTASQLLEKVRGALAAVQSDARH
jgi:signal transduction histidine kinase